MALTRLKQLREEAVLTVHELAKASGVSDDTISKIENGQRVARPNTLRKLARALNVSPQELRRPAKTEELAGAGKDEAPREAGRLTIKDVISDTADRQRALERQAEGPMLDQRYANEGMRRLREDYGLDGNDAEELVNLGLENTRLEEKNTRLEEKNTRLEEENAALRDQLQEREQAHS